MAGVHEGLHEGRYAADEPGAYASQYKRRRDRLYELIEELGIDMHRSYSGAEDLAPLLDGYEPIERWAAITHASEDDSLLYIYTYDSLAAAKGRAVENIGDDVFPEEPTLIVNLDTNRRYRPIPSYRWAPTTP